MHKAIEKPFIHVHIPKTAGTSLRATFIKNFGPEKVAYLMPEGHLLRTSDLPFESEQLDKARRIARMFGLLHVYSSGLRIINKKLIPQGFDFASLLQQDISVVTGHFESADIPESLLHLPRTTVIREPLARMWSHYTHWREARGNMWWHKGSVPFDKNTQFETFALDPELANYQSSRLGDLGFVAMGTTANLADFFEQIGVDPATRVPSLNPGRYKMPAGFNPGFLQQFDELHSADYALYDKALHQPKAL